MLLLTSLCGLKFHSGPAILRTNSAPGQGPPSACGAPNFGRCSYASRASAHNPELETAWPGETEARLKALDLVLPQVTLPVADYISFLHLDGQLFVAGQLPLKDGKLAVAGTLGAGLDLTQGQEAARLCGLNILAQAKAALGDLDRIMQCLRLNGFVNAAPGFLDHSKVINGASEIIVKVLGQKGRHTRIAVGCSSLPLGAAVEIDAIFAVD